MPGFTGPLPFVGITINAFTGQLSFTPTAIGYYTVVIKVTTYTPGGVLIGSVMRDLMFAVTACGDVPPVVNSLSNPTGGLAIASNSFYVCNGQSFCVDIMVTDNTSGSTITVTSNATLVLPGSTFTITGTNPARATLCWTGNTSLLPVTMFIQASDGACPIENVISTFLNAQPCSVLPIELLTFQAKPSNGQVVTDWTTASEHNSDYFTVERGTDGTDFQPIGRLEAAGTSSQPRDYSYIDAIPLVGASYYRLRETDLDGTSSLSDVVAVNYARPASIHAMWNGADAWSLTGAPTGAEWTLMDMLGRPIATGTITDDSAQRIPAGTSAGLHLLLVQDGEGTQLLKLPANLPAGAVVGKDREL